MIIEGHVLLIYDQAAYTLLPVSGREFITQFWPPCLPDQDLDQGLVVFGIADHDFVDVTSNRRFIGHWDILVRDGGSLATECVIVGVRWRLLVNVDISRVNPLADASETIKLNDVILFLSLPILVLGSICQPIKAEYWWMR